MTDIRRTDAERDAAMRELQAFLAERDAALRTMDIAYARKMMPGASSDDVRLCAMHKARYEMTGMEPELRRESRAWLEERGFGRLNNSQWPADDSLPE